MHEESQTLTITYSIYATLNMCGPTEKQRFVYDRFSQGEIASGKFPWVHQSE